MPKKKWQKPKLIVIVRGDSQERVLAIRKNAFDSSLANPLLNYAGCILDPGVCETWRSVLSPS